MNNAEYNIYGNQDLSGMAFYIQDPISWERDYVPKRYLNFTNISVTKYKSEVDKIEETFLAMGIG